MESNKLHPMLFHNIQLIKSLTTVQDEFKGILTLETMEHKRRKLQKLGQHFMFSASHHRIKLWIEERISARVLVHLRNYNSNKISN